MFQKDFLKFKILVEDTIWNFFKMTPDELKSHTLFIEKINPDIDFNKPELKNGEMKEVWYTWATAKYFLNVYQKCIEMMECLTSNGVFEEVNHDH